MVIRSSNGLLRSDWTMGISRGSRINHRRMLPDPTAQTHPSRNPRSVLMDIFHPPPRLHSFFLSLPPPSDPLPSPPMQIPLVPLVAATHPSEPRRHPPPPPPSLSPRLPRPRPTSPPLLRPNPYPAAMAMAPPLGFLTQPSLAVARAAGRSLSLQWQ